jgi:AraC-like DNA-binding protein
MTKIRLSDQVVEFVMSCDDNELRKLTVTSLASRLNVDRSHLTREFKTDKKLILSRFIQGEKMTRAATLLRNTKNLTVETLSKRLGFCSAEYFREVFKKHFAVAPTEYRRYRNNGKTEHSAS